MKELSSNPEAGISPANIVVIEGNELQQCKSLIWNTHRAWWEVQELDRLKLSRQDDHLLLGIPADKKYKMVKGILPVPVGADGQE